MNSFRRLIPAVLCVTALVALPGCGGGEGNGSEPASGGPATGEQQPASLPAESTPPKDASTPDSDSSAASEPEHQLAAASPAMTAASLSPTAPPEPDKTEAEGAETTAPASARQTPAGESGEPAPPVSRMTVTAPDDDDDKGSSSKPEQPQKKPSSASALTGNRPIQQPGKEGEPKGPEIRRQEQGAKVKRGIDPAGEIFVVAEPERLDLGEIPTGDAKAGVIRLVNKGTEPRTLLNCKTSCGCTTANCQKGKQIQPGESIEVEVKLRVGPMPRKLTKNVTFMISEQPPIQVSVAGQGIAFVEVEPKELCSDASPDGRLVLRAADGSPFAIKSMYPPLIEEFSGERGIEQEVFIPWDRWEELGGQRKLLFHIDHSKSQRVYGQVCMADVRRVRDKIRKERGEQVARRPPAPPTAKTDIEQLLKSGKHEEAIKLIDDGEIIVGSVDKTGRTPLSKAAELGAADVIEALLDASADMEAADSNGKTPLMWAGQSGSSEAVKALLEAGADIAKRDGIGSTALSWSAGFGSAATVQTLLKAGAEVDVVTRVTGWTPLAWAAAFGEPESVKALIDAGANLEAAGILQGTTPLMHAVRTGGIENTKLLLAAGASLEARDMQGKTALLVAASNSGADAEIINLLVDAGADLSLRDSAGHSVLDLARKRTDIRSAVVIEVLESYFPDSEQHEQAEEGEAPDE